MVYVCATCYDTPTINGIYVYACRCLPVHSRVIIIDKHFQYTPEGEGQVGVGRGRDAGVEQCCFELRNSCEIAVTWGTAVAYLYEKTRCESEVAGTV